VPGAGESAKQKAIRKEKHKNVTDLMESSKKIDQSLFETLKKLKSQKKLKDTDVDEIKSKC
jgi:hypothetical protein